MSEDRINLHVGSLEEMGRRFVSAWKAAERGEAIERDHVTFVDLEAFLAVMSPRRLELLRHLRAHGPMSVRRLSSEVRRDYKSVHQDVALLATAGLIERTARDQVTVTWNKAVTELDLAA